MTARYFFPPFWNVVSTLQYTEWIISASLITALERLLAGLPGFAQVGRGKGEKNFNSFSAHLFSVPLCKMDVKGKAILDRLITQLAVLEEQGLGHSLFFFVYNRIRFLMLGRSD